jgi:putative Holliday junction resolvase
MVRWLALDVGARRVGVAVCDDEERVASTVGTIPFVGAADLASRVAVLAAERGAGGAVVGWPVTRAGTGRGEQRVAAVTAALQACGMVVESEDERGSTGEATARLREAGASPRRIAALVDAVAAQVILEAFLSRRGRPGPR